MLFKEVDDCDICPFCKGNEKEYGSEFSCTGDPNQSHPCEWMDEYGDMTLQEVVDAVNDKVYAAEAYWEKQWLAKKEKEKKKAELLKKREKTRAENYGLNKEISRLRSLIKRREDAISSLSSLHSAFGIANAIMEGKDPNSISDNHPQILAWKEANIRDTEKLNQLLKERELRNKERRKKK